MENRAVYTQGSIAKTMLKTALAMVPGTFAMSGYNIADTYFVGQLGETPLAAMGFTFPMIMLIACLFHGLSVGVMTPSAHAIGSHRKPKAAKLMTYGLALILVTAIAVGVAGLLTVDPLFTMFGAKGNTLDAVKGYMNIWYLGSATAALTMSGNNLLIAVGDSKMASGMMMAGLVLNVILDPIFIFGFMCVPAMGIEGAAIATVISQFASGIILVWILYRRHQLIRFEKLPWAQIRAAWRVMVRFAIPASIGMLMMPIGSVIITRITATFGDAAVAATAASGRLEMAAFVFPMALGITLMPMVGQNYGAKLYDRIRACHHFSMTFAFVYLLAMAVVYYLFTDFLVSMFTPDPEVQRIMKICMQIIPWGGCMIEIHRYAGFFFTGCGHPRVSAYLNALRIVGLMIPFALIAYYLHSLEGLFWSRMLADIIAGGIAVFCSYRLVKNLPVNGQSSTSVSPSEIQLGMLGSAQADVDQRSATQ